MIVYHEVEQGSPEWKALRAPLWTGSKAIRLLQGKPFIPESDFGGNQYTRRGQTLETIALQEYERNYRQHVRRVGFITNTVYPNAGYSPDGLVGNMLLEVKCLNGEKHEKLVAGEIKLDYLVQIYFGMIVTGLRKAKLLAFNPEYEQQLTVINIPYDKAIGDNIRKKLRADLKKLLTQTSVRATV